MFSTQILHSLSHMTAMRDAGSENPLSCCWGITPVTAMCQEQNMIKLKLLIMATCAHNTLSLNVAGIRCTTRTAETGGSDRPSLLTRY